MFRALGINYLDQAGNTYINFDGVRIDVRGRRAVKANLAPSNTVDARGGVNLFSPKRAQVIFAILSWPELITRPVRDIAAAAGVSLGQVQQTLDLLVRYGLLGEGKQFLDHKRQQLIDQWAAAYRTGLGSHARTKFFSGAIDHLESEIMPLYISGEAAVPDLLRPETLVLYTRELPTDLIRTHRWRRNDDRPNIFLRPQFWQIPGEAEKPGPHKAPWLLIYADLLASGDGRQREAASHLLEVMR